MPYRALLVLLLLAACAESSPPAPIPAPLAETIPRPPVSPVPLKWQPGHWDWTGTSYVWIPGQFVESAGLGGTWMPRILGEDRLRLGMAASPLDVAARPAGLAALRPR